MVVELTTPAWASSNVIDNGDFSSPVEAVGSYSLVSTGTSITGWRVVGVAGNVGVMGGTFQQSGITFEPDHSSQWLDLTGSSDSATGVTQSVSTVAGTRYALQFAVGNVYNPGGIFGLRSTVAVLVNGQRVFTATNSKGRGSSRQIWENFKTSVVAVSNATTLEFLNEDPLADSSNGLDHVSLSQIGAAIVPSSIATSIPTPREALFPLSTLAANGGIAAAVALLLTFPSQLFNQTLQENYGNLALWWRRRFRWLPWPRARRIAQRQTETIATPVSIGSFSRDLSYLENRWVFILVFLSGALANALNDGSFGLNLSSFVTFVAVVFALAIGVTVPTLVGSMYHTLRHGSSPRKLVALPAGLALAVVMVVFSRLINFDPGYLYGFVCGILFTRELPTNERGHVAALNVCTTLTLSALVWVAWVPVNAAAERPGAFVGVVLADDLLGALFVSGLVGSFFGMMPIRGLPGWTIKQWSTSAWVVAFGISVLGLFQILLRPGIAGHGHRPLIMSVILFVLFGAVSVIFHEYFERKNRRARYGKSSLVAEHSSENVGDA